MLQNANEQDRVYKKNGEDWLWAIGRLSASEWLESTHFLLLLLSASASLHSGGGTEF